MSDRSFTEAAAVMRAAFDRAFAEPPIADREPAVDLLAIRVGATHLALRLEDVAEIATDRVIVPVPSDAATLIGLAGMRGVIVAVHHLGSLLGVATGLLWAPCAGPILGIILTGAALSGASSTTAGLLLAYALGAATSLALALLVGGKVFAAMKRSIGAGEGLRRALGLLILVGVGTIALGLDTRVLARLSTAQTFAFEHRLAQLLGMEEEELTTRTGGTLPVEGELPALDGARETRRPLSARPARRPRLGRASAQGRGRRHRAVPSQSW